LLPATQEVCQCAGVLPLSLHNTLPRIHGASSSTDCRGQTAQYNRRW